ncbi:MAG: hypothetical protein U0R50_17005 [Gaiellales bacterium]
MSSIEPIGFQPLSPAERVQPTQPWRRRDEDEARRDDAEQDDERPPDNADDDRPEPQLLDVQG